MAYQNAQQAVLDAQLSQVYYRSLGLVSIHQSVSDSAEAAQYLSANGRGGTIQTVVPGRVYLWLGVAVAPDLPGSQTMGVLMFGSGTAQLNTVLLRVAFWAPRLWGRLVGAV